VNVKEIVKLSATYLQLEDVLKLQALDGEEESPTELTLKNYELLLKATNLVQEEIASDYIPLKAEEIVEVTNEEIAFSSLSERIIQVLFIKNELEQEVKYKLFPTSIKLENGTYKIVYSYMPSTVTITDSFAPFSNKITERIVAYAVAGEYALINGLFDEATTWKQRFEEAMKVVIGKKSPITILSRRWL